jgi:ATP-dependent Clp protease adaptor protein ClpS
MSTGNTKSATATPNQATAVLPEKPKPRMLPMFKVLLHNDDQSIMEDVVATILMLTPLQQADAVNKTVEAHKTGVALLLITHRERAELYVEQFQSRQLTVTIEPVE